MLLQVKNITQAYQKNQITFEDVSFELQENELLCLLGPSGCGKSTLLQCLAGFEPIERGRIFLNGRDITELPPEKRGVGLVFQDYSLFPHFTISQNIAYGLKNFSKKSKKERVDELISLFDLQGHENKYPHELSGGEQQRVAIARAMAPRPEVILFDEAFSNLDPGLRHKLRQDLKDLLSKTQTSAIFITHDQEEAFDLGDRIAILYDQKIQQIASAYELYHYPKTEFMARFIGSNQFIDGTCDGSGIVKTALGDLEISNHGPAGDVLVYLPYSSFKINEKKEDGLQAIVRRKSFRGEAYCYDVYVPEINKEFSMIRDFKDLKINQEVGLSIERERLNKVFPRFL